MKTKRKRTIVIFLSLIMITAGLNSFAQRGWRQGLGRMGNVHAWDSAKTDFQRPARGSGQFGMRQGMMRNDYCPLLDLTDEQAEQIKELRLAHYKEVQPLRDQLSELAIKHRNLMRTEDVDTKAINASIDEKTNVMNKLMKKQAEFQKEFRILLTDEQKMKLDKTGRGFGKRRGMGNVGRIGRNSFSGGFNRW